MRSEYGSVVGGIVGGLAISVAMDAGRRNGWLHKTLAEDAEDWLDRTLETRTHIGPGGTTALEQTNHLLASAGFGLANCFLQNRFPRTPVSAWVPRLAQPSMSSTSPALRRYSA
jgi:hypothetical protein